VRPVLVTGTAGWSGRNVPLRGGGKGPNLMARRRLSSRDEQRYWKMRIVLEFARVAAEVAWDVLRRGGAAPF
jgi:hypothetical protein